MGGFNLGDRVTENVYRCYSPDCIYDHLLYLQAQLVNLTEGHKAPIGTRFVTCECQPTQNDLDILNKQMADISDLIEKSNGTIYEHWTAIADPAPSPERRWVPYQSHLYAELPLPHMGSVGIDVTLTVLQGHVTLAIHVGRVWRGAAQ